MGNFRGDSYQYEGGFPITPGTAFIQPCRAIYVGVAGNISLTTIAGQTLTLTNVPVGLLQMGASAVASGGTTATGLVGLY
jgi:hypothetical protein